MMKHIAMLSARGEARALVHLTFSSSNKCKWKVYSDDATYMFVVGVVDTLES